MPQFRLQTRPGTKVLFTGAGAGNMLRFSPLCNWDPGSDDVSHSGRMLGIGAGGTGVSREIAMKNKQCHSVAVGMVEGSRTLEVQVEVEKFLLALDSYPDRFAIDPRLSFEQHLFSIMATEAVFSQGQRVH